MAEYTPEPTAGPAAKRRISPLKAALIGVAALAVGGGATAVAYHAGGTTVEMAPVNPVPISGLADDSLVTVRGRVAEIFGNKAILDDGTGRALIDLGRAGEDGGVVEAGQTVTVQGRFNGGQLRASFLIDAAGNTRALGGGGPHGGPKEKGRDGPGRDGPGRDGPGRDGPPPVAGQAPPPVAATAPASMTANQAQAVPQGQAPVVAPAPAARGGGMANTQGM